MRAILLGIVSIVFFNGCIGSFGYVRNDSSGLKQSEWPFGCWVESIKEQQYARREIIEYLTNKYPLIDNAFPNLRIVSVQVKNNGRKNCDITVLEQELQTFFNTLSTDIIPNSQNRPTWDVELEIEAMEYDISLSGETALVLAGLSSGAS